MYRDLSNLFLLGQDDKAMVKWFFHDEKSEMGYAAL
jgi:hypothetical protein